MSEERPGVVTEPVRGRGSLFWAFVVLVVAGLIGLLSWIWLAKQGIDAGRETAVEIASAFDPEEVIQTFAVFREMEAKGTDGNLLEVATATATENFSRSSNVQMFGRTLPLGTTVSEIDVPATYRYHIDLLDEWRLTADGNRLTVVAPDIRPTLPVAFDTRGVRKRTQAGWARWDGQKNLEELEQSITHELGVRAGSDRAIRAIREEARLAVARFVETWLVSRNGWEPGRFEEILVTFGGELEPPPSLQPTILVETSTEE